MSGTVADTESEVRIRAEAGSVRLTVGQVWAAERWALGKHIGDAGLTTLGETAERGLSHGNANKGGSSDESLHVDSRMML